MPALPHRGPSDMGIAAEHDNADLDEMDDLDEEEEDEEEGGAASEEDEASSPSLELEVPAMGRRMRVLLPPSLSRSPRSELPPIVASSPFDVTFQEGSAAGSEAAATRERSASVANRATQYFTPTDPVPPVDLASPMSIATVRRTPGTQMDYLTSRFKLKSLPRRRTYLSILHEHRGRPISQGLFHARCRCLAHRLDRDCTTTARRV